MQPLYTPEDWSGESYLENLGFPGQVPMTRGIYPTMHRGRTWSQRQLIGLGTPEDYNARLRRILDAGGEIVGKAECESLCFSGGSHTNENGPIRNPHNPEHTAGGSSAGSAALANRPSSPVWMTLQGTCPSGAKKTSAPPRGSPMAFSTHPVTNPVMGASGATSSTVSRSGKLTSC